ncbi:MAG: hypothetical protein WBB73_02400 [Candidatus Aminicenantaceae bacterium]
MKKTTALVCLLVFVQFTAVYAFSPELMVKDFRLDKENASDSEVKPFSLKATYSPELMIDDPVLFADIAQDTDTDAAIKQLKSKRMWSWVGAIGFTAVGAGLMYLFATYEDPTTKNQLGEDIGHTQTNSMTQYGYLIGALISLGVTAFLISGAVKSGKSIKEYEAELKASASLSRR